MEPVLLTSWHRSPKGASGGDPWKHHPHCRSGAPRVGSPPVLVQAPLPRPLLTTPRPAHLRPRPSPDPPSALPMGCISGQGKRFSLNYPRLFLTGDFGG